MSFAEQEKYYTDLLNKIGPSHENWEEISLYLWYVKYLRQREESGPTFQNPGSIIEMGDI